MQLDFFFSRFVLFDEFCPSHYLRLIMTIRQVFNYSCTRPISPNSGKRYNPLPNNPRPSSTVPLLRDFPPLAGTASISRPHLQLADMRFLGLINAPSPGHRFFPLCPRRGSTLMDTHLRLFQVLNKTSADAKSIQDCM